MDYLRHHKNYGKPYYTVCDPRDGNFPRIVERLNINAIEHAGYMMWKGERREINIVHRQPGTYQNCWTGGFQVQLF